jgi:hypothetical protein
MKRGQRDRNKTSCVKQYSTRGGFGFVLTSVRKCLGCATLVSGKLKARG